MHFNNLKFIHSILNKIEANNTPASGSKEKGKSLYDFVASGDGQLNLKKVFVKETTMEN